MSFTHEFLFAMKREHQRGLNRARMPLVTAFVDEMKEVFGEDQVTVTWASENGYEVGDRNEPLEVRTREQIETYLRNRHIEPPEYLEINGKRNG